MLDLDNTLWGGVLGEDGLEGIALGDDYPGSCFRAFQREVLRWRRAGVLIAIASKNNVDDALEALREHPEMQLGPQDLDHLEIHWEPKPVSVQRILETFNIGQEAVLFVDDNPRERDAVAQAFPRIRLFDFPDEPLEIVPRFRRLPWPVFGATSEEDGRRAELQRQQSHRV
ncbi:MAG: HAD-IIIC family phosphatase, partial [Planctomycetes bacterium]|nr:HAD-IIIC family phosphatase [Planctomycetota bacterium]